MSTFSIESLPQNRWQQPPYFLPRIQEKIPLKLRWNKLASLFVILYQYFEKDRNMFNITLFQVFSFISVFVLCSYAFSMLAQMCTQIIYCSDFPSVTSTLHLHNLTCCTKSKQRIYLSKSWINTNSNGVIYHSWP